MEGRLADCLENEIKMPVANYVAIGTLQVFSKCLELIVALVSAKLARREPLDVLLVG